MFAACSCHLRGMKLLVKYELLQSWSHGFLLLLKFEMNVSSKGVSLMTGVDQPNNSIRRGV